MHRALCELIPDPGTVDDSSAAIASCRGVTGSLKTRHCRTCGGVTLYRHKQAILWLTVRWQCSTLASPTAAPPKLGLLVRQVAIYCWLDWRDERMGSRGANTALQITYLNSVVMPDEESSGSSEDEEDEEVEGNASAAGDSVGE